MYKEDLALNNLQCLMYHKRQSNQNKFFLREIIFATFLYENVQVFPLNTL